ncbi:hypothetical protein [Herbiconiux sp. YIM B11900]|uniref:hypothetical protein n=1 Tax=Herbiconiux sp. YIM B11900 TaxID=3404131 RepID=UPI003F87F9EE
MGKIRERWRPSSVVGVAVVGLFGVGVLVLAVATVATELWGQPLLTITGAARRVPVWLAWAGVVAALVGGSSLVASSAGYLIRVARGRVPRVPPSREDRRRRAASRRRAYDARKRDRDRPQQ